MLVSVLTYLLLAGLLIFIISFNSLFQEQAQNRVEHLLGQRMLYLYDDIAGNMLSEFFNMNTLTVFKNENVTVILSNVTVNTSFIPPSLTAYETFLENQYAHVQHASISLEGMNYSLLLRPYNTSLSLQKGLYFYTLPTSTNYLQKVDINLYESGQFNGSCLQPSGNSGSVLVTIIHHASGSSCATGRWLDADEDNDHAGGGWQGGKQFYQSLTDGWAEVKYGLINDTAGTISLTTSNSVQADIQLQYRNSFPPEKVRLVNGRITLQVGAALQLLTRTDELAVAGE